MSGVVVFADRFMQRVARLTNAQLHQEIALNAMKQMTPGVIEERARLCDEKKRRTLKIQGRDRSWQRI